MFSVVLKISAQQIAAFESDAQARFRRNLAEALERARPEQVARLRSGYISPWVAQTRPAEPGRADRDGFARFMADAQRAAEAQELDEDGDSAAFAALMIELERLGGAQDGFFDFLAAALAREGARGAARMGLALTRLQALAARDPQAAEMAALVADVQGALMKKDQVT